MLIAVFTKKAENFITDLELIDAIARKDQQALETLYDRYSKLLYTLILRIVRSPAEAEDILQELYLQVWHKANMFYSVRGNLSTWLMTLARNRAIDHLRSKSHRERTLRGPEGELMALSDQTIYANPLLLLEANEAGNIVRSALRKLSKSQRDMLELAYYEGLSQSEIASKSGTPLGTVKTRMRKAMLTLKESLMKYRR